MLAIPVISFAKKMQGGPEWGYPAEIAERPLQHSWSLSFAGKIALNSGQSL